MNISCRLPKHHRAAQKKIATLTQLIHYCLHSIIIFHLEFILKSLLCYRKKLHFFFQFIYSWDALKTSKVWIHEEMTKQLWQLYHTKSTLEVGEGANNHICVIIVAWKRKTQLGPLSRLHLQLSIRISYSRLDNSFFQAFLWHIMVSARGEN